MFEDEIQQLVISIWDSVLQRTLEPAEQGADPGPGTMTAYVQITGNWDGAVVLTCDTHIAAEAASVMFDISQADATSSDIQDALGELANIVGGNLKGLLPEPCYMSLPTVIDGSQYCSRVPGSKLLTRVPFHREGRSLCVSLLQRELAA
jgi:chemotaxis protein CheX